MTRLRCSLSRPLPLRPHPAPNGLELPLLPLPAARHWANAFVLALGLHGGELLLGGHWFMAAGMMLLAGAARLLLRRMALQGPRAPRRLLLAADGRVYVHCVGGAVVQVVPGGDSLWLGSAVLLVLHGPRHVWRVLLGAGNLDPAALATLRRRLRGAAVAGGEPAVDSGPTHRRSAGRIEQFSLGFLA